MQDAGEGGNGRSSPPSSSTVGVPGPALHLVDRPEAELLLVRSLLAENAQGRRKTGTGQVRDNFSLQHRVVRNQFACRIDRES
jgi:hypothetical protein